MNESTFDRPGSVSQQARSFLTRAKEVAGDLVDRVKELGEELMWVDHFRLAPVGNGLMVTHDAIGTGLSGLVVSPRTSVPPAGDDGYLLEAVLEVPPGFFLRGIRVGLDSSGPGCCLNLVRISQVNDPPDSALLVSEDTREDRTSGPVAIEAEATSVDPKLGPVVLSLGFWFDDPGGWLVIRGLGIRLSRNPS